MITVFLDESSTHAGSSGVLVGAVVTPDAGTLERQVVSTRNDLLADAIYWHKEAHRDKFLRQGFHHADDNDTIRQAFIQAFRSMDFRGHVAFSRRGLGLDDATLMLNMYYTIVRNILLRYRTTEMRFVFETETKFNEFYGRIVEVAKEDVAILTGFAVNADVRIGSKAAPALSLADYILALANKALFSEPREFEKAQINYGLDLHLAHLIDFDRRVHQSARKGIELL